MKKFVLLSAVAAAVGSLTVVATGAIAGPAAPAAPALVIESLDGPVTSKEISSFVDHMKAVQPPTNNIGNAMVYGAGGRNLEALGQMYEVSGKTEILDQKIKYADTFLAGRNNPQSGRVLWTGKRELAWPNKETSAPDATYSGTENGDVIAHIAYAAKTILQKKSLWDTKVPFGDPHGYGATYLARAKTYVKELDRTIDTFLAPHFVKSGSNRFYFPDTDAWSKIGPRYERSRGKPVPWNQQAMLGGGFQRLAECHQLLGDDPARVSRYDAIVKANIDWFLSDVKEKTVNGQRVYDWGYSLGRTSEDVGHGAYDMLGLYRAFTRNAYQVPKDKVQTFARTLNRVIYLGSNQFAKRVDGTGGTQNHMLGEWLGLASVDGGVYKNVAAADVASGRPKSTPALHAAIVWVKDARHKGTFPK
ncbi:hypothetical protein [Streptomyces sp. KR80]|uniref:hypothetical protein n=1 Tax=Streptomyces sp. KR80 TaxID=3457426 RepID=UPI003FD23BFE